MKLYYRVIEATQGSEWITKCDSKEEAIREAERTWNHLTATEKKTTGVMAVEFSQAEVDADVEAGVFDEDEIDSNCASSYDVLVEF